MIHGFQTENLRYPSNAVNPVGGVSDPDRDSTLGTFLFDAASTEILLYIVQIPHGWMEGSDIEPHVHWAKTSSASGNVLWKLEYKIWKTNEVLDAAFTTLSTVSSVNGDTDDQDTEDQQLISTFGRMSLPGGFKASDFVIFKLSRVGGDAADTYGADAELIEFDIHIKLNSLGTDEDF